MPSTKPKVKNKYTSKLHALIAKGPVPTKRAWQDSILTYLTQNCTVSNSLLKRQEQSLYFPSPLPVNVVPKGTLLNQLKLYEHGDTPLLLAVRCNCTTDVISALCHLFPDGAKVPDKEGMLPLHVAALRPTEDESSNRRKKKKSSENEVSKTVGILLEANPVAIVARDHSGRTPLHCLLENHPETRNMATVELFSRIVEEKVWRFEVEAKAQQEDQKVALPIPSLIRKKLPKEANTSGVNLYTPASALTIPDTIMGAIPLHYAVKHGVSKDIIAYMIKSYPASVCQIDSRSHTPLHWVFGLDGNEGKPDEVPAHHTYRSSSIIALLLQRDPSQTYNVASMRDINLNGEPHRTPLHYAVELLAKNIIDPIPLKGKSGETSSSCITLKSLKAMVDADSKSLITRDSLGQTPLHILFRTIFEMNHKEYLKALSIAKTGAQSGDEPTYPKTFSPPKVLVELLIHGSPQERIKATTIADVRGLLPLHVAVLSLASPTVLGILIDSNPKALTHLTSVSCDDAVATRYDLIPTDDSLYTPVFEGSRTPLHMAFCCPFFIDCYSDVMIERLLFYDSSISGNPVQQSDEDEPSHIKIDASIALKMQDANGNTPLHLAAKHMSSYDRLKNLLKRDISASRINNNDGDLPLHLLLDKEFLFVNAELLSAHSGPKDSASPLSTQHSPEFRERVRELAKKQTVAARMAKFKLCGAIFAPTSGWTNDDEDSGHKDQLDFMKKINLLGMPLINDEQTLNMACSKYGLIPLQLLVAFHAAPYEVIEFMLQRSPKTRYFRSTSYGYTALDLHIFRKSIPGEIKKHELEAWRAIRQILFISSDIFPLDALSDKESDKMFTYRKDRDMLKDCEEQIVAEITGQTELCYHRRGNHPIEPDHLVCGFLDNFQTDDSTPEQPACSLSERSYWMWLMFTCYFNIAYPKDNYAESVRNVLGELDFGQIDKLTNMVIPPFAFQNIFDSSEFQEFPAFIIRNYANVYCKDVMYSHNHFAGLYTFNPPADGSSILIHRERTGQSILVQATKKIFSINSPDMESDNVDSSWMFTPISDVRFRRDFTLTEIPVCFKFMKNKLPFTRELNWRSELGKLNSHSSIVPIIESFDVEAFEVSKRYIKDRQDERFRKMALRSHVNKTDITEWINLAQYPYAIVLPFSDGNLHDVLSHGLIEPEYLKPIGVEMGYLLQDFHKQGLVHGAFGARSVLSFVRQANGLWRREWKLSGLNSIVPTGQTSVYLGAISPDGRTSFDSSLLPPEMFKKIDPLEQAFYNNYWRAVSDLANVNIPKDLISPRIDPVTGDIYVVKCYCDLDEQLRRSLPPLPYDLVESNTGVDIWAFGAFLFTLITGGETLFQSNLRMGSISSIELVANWNTDVAAAVIQKFVHNPAAQDLLLFLLSPVQQRRQIDMNTVLCHPYFISDEAMIPKEVITALVETREERLAEAKLQMKKNHSETKANEMKNESISLSRLSLKNHLLLVNSTTEVIREAFDPDGSINHDVPYCFIVLPYKLAKNKAGKLTPTSMTDVELCERLGKHILELCKATCFASCMREYYANATKESLETIHYWSTSLDKYPIQTAEEILKTFHLDTENFLDLASKFVAIVRADGQNFLQNPTISAMKLIRKYAVPITQIFAVNGKAYLYPVDEFKCMPVVESSKGRKYPHTFRDCVSDVVYKFLPYMQSCITRMMSESGSVESLVKLIFEGAAPKTPNSWVQAAKGLPKVFLKRRMVAEASILQEAILELIPSDSPVSSGTKHELDFIHSLFSHIDSTRAFGGLRKVSDGESMMWTAQEGVDVLVEDSNRESDPEMIYYMYKKEEELKSIMEEKDAKIAKLEKTIDSLSKQVQGFHSDSPEMEI